MSQGFSRYDTDLFCPEWPGLHILKINLKKVLKHWLEYSCIAVRFHVVLFIIMKIGLDVTESSLHDKLLL